MKLGALYDVDGKYRVGVLSFNLSGVLSFNLSQNSNNQ